MSMADLVKLSEHVAYIPGAVNIGVIMEEKKCVIIDTGLDKNSGRSIRKTLESEGLTLETIINTHSHADHFGGNDYLVRNLKAKVYAPRIESGIIQNPILEPIYLFHGATPIRNLRNKFVYAKRSPVDKIIKPGKLEVSGVSLEVVALPGHSFNQIGVLVEDTLFCADSVFSPRVIKKYKIPVIQDVKSHLKTLDMLEKTSYSDYIPAHTRSVKDITELVEENREVTCKIISDVLKITGEARTCEEVVSALCSMYGLDLSVIQQYYLIQMTIMAYLGYLYDDGRLDIEVKENNLYWRKNTSQ